MNKKITLAITVFFISFFLNACQSDKNKNDSEQINVEDSIPSLSDTLIKTDKEKSDSILKYYQDKAKESEG